MKSTKILVALGFFATVVSMNAQTNAQASRKEVQAVAARALSTFDKLVTEQNYKAMGFDSLKEVKAATLGEPFAVEIVRLDDLRGYQAGSDPNKLLKALDKLIYLVLIKEDVRSSITVEKVKESWKATSFGGPNMAKLLSKARKDSAEATRLPLASYFTVQVPALNAYFVAHRAESKLMLTPIYDNPALKLSAGKSLPAEEVFAALVPVAQRYNGLPL